MNDTFQALEVINKTSFSQDAVAIRLARPGGGPTKYAIQAGQFVTIKLETELGLASRCYSVARVGETWLEIGVKRVKDGQVSHRLISKLEVGDSLRVSPPAGKFVLPEVAAKHKKYFCIAAGSGITPILHIASAILKRDQESQLILIFSNKNAHQLMYADALQALKNQYNQRFQWQNVFSQDKSNWPISQGRIDAIKLNRFKPGLGNLENLHKAFLCGPDEMVDELRKTLVTWGISRQDILSEQFHTPGQTNQLKPKRLSQQLEQLAARKLKVILEGSSHELTIADQKASLLDIALAKGLDVPYGCTAGVCETCKARLIEGQIDNGEEVITAGSSILCCLARAISSSVTIDFDQN